MTHEGTTTKAKYDAAPLAPSGQPFPKLAVPLSKPWAMLWWYCGFQYALDETGVVDRTPKCSLKPMVSSERKPPTLSYLVFIRVFNWICFFLCFFAFIEHKMFDTLRRDTE